MSDLPEEAPYLWETLGSSKVFHLPSDRDHIVDYIVQDDIAGAEHIERMESLRPGQHFLVNESDPEWIERWSRL